MRLKIAPLALPFLAATTGAFSSAVADEIAIDFGRTINPERTEMFFADVSGPNVAIRTEISGTPLEQEDEIERCLFFSSFTDDPAGAIRNLKGARSKLSITFLVAEVRANDSVGRQWISSLQNLEEKYGTSFEDLDSMDYFVPFVTSLNFEFTGEVYDDYDGAPEVQLYFLDRLQRDFRRAYEMGKGSFDGDGILRVSTQGQASVCAFLIYEEILMTMEITGRLPDRVVDDQYLDRECLNQMVTYATEEIPTRFPFLDREDLGEVDLGFFLGTIVQETPGGGLFSGPLDEGDIPCSIGLNDEEEKIQAMIQWTRLVEEWEDILRRDPDGVLGTKQLAELTKYSHRSMREATLLTYTYETQLVSK